jgi:hypothetical protein
LPPPFQFFVVQPKLDACKSQVGEFGFRTEKAEHLHGLALEIIAVISPLPRVVVVLPSPWRPAQLGAGGFVPRVPFVGRHYRIDQGLRFLTIMLG